MPHWELDQAIYSITFRLADALPRHVIDQLKAERLLIERVIAGGKQSNSIQADEISRMFFIRLDEQLDCAYGECLLRRPEIARIVIGALAFFNHERYELLAWCVMPNHVHVVLQLRSDLAKVLHSWKSYSASKANELLRRQGTFWEREYHDRIIRDSSELVEKIRYVVANPEKAGLANWPYVWSIRDNEW